MSPFALAKTPNKLRIDAELPPSMGAREANRPSPTNDCSTSPRYNGAQGAGFMQIVLLGCLLGAGCAMALWASAAARATIEEIVRRGGTPFPPGEP
jgi:predicted phage tail protein